MIHNIFFRCDELDGAGNQTPIPVNLFTGKVFLKCTVCLRYALRLEKGPSGPMLIFPLVIGGNGLHSTDDIHKIKLIWVFGLMRNLWPVFDFRT